MKTSTKLKIAIGAACAYMLLRAKPARAGMATSTFGSMLVRATVNLQPLNQGDPRWKSQTVGNGTRTYGEIGCVVTAITMTANALRGLDYLPPDLRPGGRAGLTSHDYTGGAVRSSSDMLQRLGCRVGSWSRGMPYTPSGIAQLRSEIEAALNAGGIALVRVDYDTGTPEDNHTVVCFGYSDAGYACCDPAGGVFFSLDHNLKATRGSKTYYAVGVLQAFA